MNTEPAFSPDELEVHEVRLLAVLLGEASAAETAAIESLVTAHPQLKALRARLVLTIGLLRDTARVASGEKAPAQLSPERRQALLAVLSGKTISTAGTSESATTSGTSETTPPPAPTRSRPRPSMSFRQVLLHPYVGWAGLAACLVLGFAGSVTYHAGQPFAEVAMDGAKLKEERVQSTQSVERLKSTPEPASDLTTGTTLSGDRNGAGITNHLSDTDGDRLVAADKRATLEDARPSRPKAPVLPENMVPPASESTVTLTGGSFYSGSTTSTSGALRVVPESKPGAVAALSPSPPAGAVVTGGTLALETVSNTPAPAATPASAAASAPPSPSAPATPPPVVTATSELTRASRGDASVTDTKGRQAGRGGVHGARPEEPAPAKPSGMAKSGTGTLSLDGTAQSVDGPVSDRAFFGVVANSGPAKADVAQNMEGAQRSGGGSITPKTPEIATLNFLTASDASRDIRQKGANKNQPSAGESNEFDSPGENGRGAAEGLGRGLAMAGKRREADGKPAENTSDFFFTTPEPQQAGQKQAPRNWDEKAAAAAQTKGTVYYEDAIVTSDGGLVETRKGVKNESSEGGFGIGGGASYFRQPEGEKALEESGKLMAKDSRDRAGREDFARDRDGQSLQEQSSSVGSGVGSIGNGDLISNAKSEDAKDLGNKRAKQRAVDEVSTMEKMSELQKKVKEQDLKSEFKKSGQKDNQALGIISLTGELTDQQGKDRAQEELAKAKVAPPTLNPADISTPTVTAANAFSTFALNVSDASFRLTRDHLNRGTWDATQIRPEEFYNAFSYRDPVPAANEPIGLTQEIAAHPFTPGRLLVRLAVQTQAQGRAPQQPLHLTVLLDNSGSMERPDRREAALAALSGLAQNLGPGDTVSLLSFSATPRLWLDQVSGEQAGKLPETAAQLPAEGGTNLEAALEAGYAQAARSLDPRAQNALVLLTDGSANLGNADANTLSNLVAANRLRGIAFHAYGVGQADLNDATLERLARNGDGRYAVLGTPEEAEAQLVGPLAGSFRPAALDVKVQVEWNASRVKTHRLVGFAERRLTKEQFRDNTVDGGELAAAASGNALYAVEPIADGTGPLGTVRVRYRDPVTGSYRELSWPVAYDPGLPSFSSAPRGLRLAGVASLLAERLQGQPAAQDTDLAELRKAADQLASEDAAEPIKGLAQMVRQAESLLNNR